jgi:ATP-binding cassette subfamily B multidrug efflux pump
MQKKQQNSLKVFKRLLTYLSPYKFILFSGLLFTIFAAIISSVRPMLIIEMINVFISNSAETSGYIESTFKTFVTLISDDTNPQAQLLTWTLLLLVLLIIEAFLQFLIAYLAALMGQSVIRDVRIQLFEHIQSFKLKYFDNTPNGTIVTRLISDVEAISEVFAMGLVAIMGDLLKLIFIISLMFYVNWVVAVLILIPIPLLLFATSIFARTMKKSFEKERLQVNRLNTFVQEHISGMSIVQLFNKQKPEFGKFTILNKGHRSAMLQAVWATSLFFPIVEILSSLSIAFLLLWSFLQLDYHPELVKGLAGMIFGYILWVNMLYRPIRQMADRFNILQRGVVRAERVFDILDHTESITNSGNVTDVDFNQNLSFENIWFAYKDENWVLKGINIDVKKSESIALVGTTGAGKSTIINLLTRFYEYQKGDIKIGDLSIKDINLSVLRQNIAVVLQDVFLFSDSILNNITMGDESITLEQVISASKKVGAHDFISQLPGEYDYNVRERGGVLSVGQKQLISFIRAFVFNPKILILDEATASVDSESEALIQKATTELQKGRTSIVIAHRLSTIVNSDKILVIDAGQVIESGTHSELLKIEKGQYKKLYNLNFV